MIRLALLCLLAALPAAAQQPAILGLTQDPALNAEVRAAANRFLMHNLPRAFAAGPGGSFGWQTGGGDAAFVEQRALESCQRRSNGAPCAIIARDLARLNPERAAPAAPAGTRMGGFAQEALPDPRMLWWGPGAARGVLVFAHGRAVNRADLRGEQPQSWTRHFNNAGYDVWRFDRHPGSDDAARAAGWLREHLAALRAMGYRRIVVSGQSRGGWNSLMMLETPGLADAVIAIAPASHGQLGSPEHMRALDDWRAILATARPSQARVVFANFRNDPFDPDPDRRAALAESLRGRVGALLVIDRPEGVEGHGGGASMPFNERFGPCLLGFAEATRNAC